MTQLITASVKHDHGRQPDHDQHHGDHDDDRFRLRDGVYSAVDRSGRRRLIAWPRATAIGPDHERLRRLLTALSGRPATRAELRTAWHTATGDRDGHAPDAANPEAAHRDAADHDAAGLDAVIGSLEQAGWLARTVSDGDRQLYTVHPWDEPPARRVVDPSARLSRLALLHPPEPHRAARPDDDHGAVRPEVADDHLLVLERPGGWCEIRIHDPAVAAAIAGIGAGRPDAIEQRGAADRRLPARIEERLRADLAWAGMLVPVGAEDDFRHRQWSLHELWFHDRSRLGRRGYLGDGFGGTFWARGQEPPLAPRPDPYPGRPLPLNRPDLSRLREQDPSLTTVLEDRRSIREHDPQHPITVDELAEFLYRTCRQRDTFEADGVCYVRRPYPSGGSAGELEIYPLITAVTGAPSGLHHYDAAEHALVPVAAPEHPAVQRLLRVAGHSTVAGRPPQVVIMIAARVGRLMWKYEGMAYALTLKHAGVLVQTMYCVATAMRLAPCGLGSGDSVAFAEATGRDPLIECPVGEFALGRPAPSDGGRVAS